MITNGAQSQDDYVADEARRLAGGWRCGWITIQRIVLRDDGRPLMEIVKDKNPVRARESE